MKNHKSMFKSTAMALGLLALLTASTSHALVVINTSGQLEDSDPTQVDRLFRDGVASTWGSAKAFPGTINSNGPYHYDTYNIAFAPNATQDVYYEIEYFDWYTNSPHAVAYLNSFDPSDISLGYLGDSGNTPYPLPVTFQVLVQAGGALVLNFHQVDGGPVFAPYTFEVRAFSDANYGEDFRPQGVPVPATLPLMALGLASLFLTRARKARQVAD